MIKKYLERIITFVKSHKRFTLFITVSFLLNLFLLLQRKNEKTEFITCSTYDKGMLGTYGLYRDLEDRGVPVKRIKLPIFKEIDPENDRRKTLVILSPRFRPHIWEWSIIMDWVANGNRLITSGMLGPKKRGWIPEYNFYTATSNVPAAESYVILPVDTVFPYDDTLAKLSQIQLSPIFGQIYKAVDSVQIKHFKHFSPDVLPFITHYNKPTAVKKAVGHGEWIAFTEINPFSNSVLREPSWYRFATRLFTGDDWFGGKSILFDEFHNGYRATKSFWQLLTYYQFNTGIIYLCILVLLYLFLTGIRIIPPVPERIHVHRDAIPGMRALAGLLITFGAWKGLLRREAAIIRSDLLKRDTKEPVEMEELLDRYLSRRKMPREVKSKEELAAIFKKVESGISFKDKNETLKIFNIFMFMRKEMRA